jgi:hypothetical protein
VQDRAVVWSDNRVKEQIKKFVAVGLEVGTMMEAEGEVGDIFRKIANEGHYGNANGRTRQGKYLITPSGKLLSSGNQQDPNATLKLMSQALDKWKKMSKDERLPSKLPSFEPRKNSAQDFGGRLMLDVSLRKIFPRPLTDSPVDSRIIAESGLPFPLQRFARNKPETYWEVEWNQDHAWFTAGEARRLIPAKLEKGESGKADPALVTRLARLHLLDTVRALADIYPVDAVKDATLNAEVENVVDGIAEIRFIGSIRTFQTGLRVFERTADQTSPIPKKPERGYDANLLGKAKFDIKQKRFIEFELVALGEKTGGSKLSPFDTTLMGVTLTLAKPTLFDPIEPRYLSQYDWR